MALLTEKETNALADYEKYLNSRFVYPGLVYNASLTFLNYFFGFQRSFLHLVHRDVTTGDYAIYNVETPMAKGPIDCESHQNVVKKIGDKNLAELLMDIELENDRELNEKAKDFRAEFFNKSQEFDSVIIDACLRQETKIIKPGQIDMDALYNKEICELYGVNSGYSDNHSDCPPLLMMPIIGSDKRTFAVIGAVNPFGNDNCLDYVLEKLELPRAIVTGKLQNSKLRERMTRERGHALAWMKSIDLVRTITHELRNPNTAFGGGLNRLYKESQEHPDVTLGERQEKLESLRDLAARMDYVLRAIDAASVKTTPPEKINIQYILDFVKRKYENHDFNINLEGDKTMLYLSKSIIDPVYSAIFNAVFAHNGESPVYITDQSYPLDAHDHHSGFITDMHMLNIYCPEMEIPGCGNNNLHECILKNGNAKALRPLFNVQKMLEIDLYGKLKLKPAGEEKGINIEIHQPIYPRTMPADGLRDRYT